MSTSKLAIMTLAAMAASQGYSPFPGAVPMTPEVPNFLNDCMKLYPTVRLIEQKKSRLSASERNQVLAGFKRRWDRLDNSQKEELQKFVQEYQS